MFIFEYVSSTRWHFPCFPLWTPICCQNGRKRIRNGIQNRFDTNTDNATDVSYALCSLSILAFGDILPSFGSNLCALLPYLTQYICSNPFTDISSVLTSNGGVSSYPLGTGRHILLQTYPRGSYLPSASTYSTGSCANPCAGLKSARNQFCLYFLAAITYLPH